MDVNLTGQFWGMPFNLAGQIAKKPEQFSIGLLDIAIIILSIIFIAYVLKKRVIPIFGEFWYHQETRPLSEHEGERFLFRKLGRNSTDIDQRTTENTGKYILRYMEKSCLP